jgi:hypothetical protein
MFAPLRSCALALVLLSGCAVSPEGDATESDSAALNAMTPEEIVGEIHYGDTVTVAYTSTPRYRAFWFNGIKGDWINVAVSSSTGSINAWVTDEAFNVQHRGAISALRKTGKFFIVVREGELADATLTINLKKRTPATH